MDDDDDDNGVQDDTWSLYGGALLTVSQLTNRATNHDIASAQKRHVITDGKRPFAAVNHRH